MAIKNCMDAFSNTPLATQDIPMLQSGTANTAATSSSSIIPHFRPTKHAFDSANHFYNVQRILPGIEDYIAVGCLSFKRTGHLNGVSPGSWRNVTSSTCLKELGFDTYTQPDVPSLLAEGWIRIHYSRSVLDPSWIILRVYLLPEDVAFEHIDRRSKKLRNGQESLIQQLDTNPETWFGRPIPGTEIAFDMFATRDPGSLFYMFNKLPSPCPSPRNLPFGYAREALEDLLDPHNDLPGLKASLYPYQRRSAGLMLERETLTKQDLDPCLEARYSPHGTKFYYGPWDSQFLKEPRMYDVARGGILAETMGLGKTVICLSLILATRDHLPEIPAAYRTPKIRSSVGTLADMAAFAINTNSVPWKVEFQRIHHASGHDMSSCVERLWQNPPQYEVPTIVPARWNRRYTLPTSQKIILAATTLIVVPPNLYKQWQSEIVKHVEADALRVLFMDTNKIKLPPPQELRTYDIVLFSRNRLEAEDRDGADEQGRRIAPMPRRCDCPYIGATRTRDCVCLTEDMLYQSPLRLLHFKRLIVDEGHFFTNANTRAMGVVNDLVQADHRWIVSGTPAKDMLGVEVGISASENRWQNSDTLQHRDSMLEQRRNFSQEDVTGAIDSLGSLLDNFLRLKPWWEEDRRSSGAAFKDHIFRHEAIRKRTFSGFASSLPRLLQNVVVKTQPEDVERDIELPPLTHRIVRLEPSFYDKLTSNLFTLVLTANAVTSERTDSDYLFHKDGRRARYQLVSNLRQSAFFWTGFSEDDVFASIKNSTGYLSKDEIRCSAEDRKLLVDALKCTESILASDGWKAMSRSHELGVFVDGFPEASAEHWTFETNPHHLLLTGISQLLQAQSFVNRRLHEPDPGEGLAGLGIKALACTKIDPSDANQGPEKTAGQLLTKSGIPASSLSGEPALLMRQNSPRKSSKAFKVTKHRKRESPKYVKRIHQRASTTKTDHDLSHTPLEAATRSDHPEHHMHPLPCDSAYASCRVVGTTSAKMSYLVSEIAKYCHQEKILVFYQGDNIAWYISQVLDLLHIEHEIYAGSLSATLKAQYVVRFDQEAEDRVLLMDVKQAAFGLNISSASRIYFVNPVCRPNVEAQAIKRAHRIGQTREVHVETLVLRGTIEERMLERAQRMTVNEHREAKALEDDAGIRQIIEQCRPLEDGEKGGREQMAPLQRPEKLWCRPGWATFGTNRPDLSLGNKKRSYGEFESGQRLEEKSELT